jgi:predicted DNA binding CopG/RHH family protein
MVRKTTSIKVEEDLWKRVKIYCVTEGVDISDYLEEIINKDLKKKLGK